MTAHNEYVGDVFRQSQCRCAVKYKNKCTNIPDKVNRLVH